MSCIIYVVYNNVMYNIYVMYNVHNQSCICSCKSAVKTNTYKGRFLMKLFTIVRLFYPVNTLYMFVNVPMYLHAYGVFVIQAHRRCPDCFWNCTKLHDYETTRCSRNRWRSCEGSKVTPLFRLTHKMSDSDTNLLFVCTVTHLVCTITVQYTLLYIQCAICYCLAMFLFYT